MAVTIALAEYRDEPIDPRLEAEAFDIGCNETLAGELGSAIERGLDRKGRVFRRRHEPRFAVDRPGRSKGDFLDVVGAHRLEHVERGYRILFEVLARMFEAEAHVGIGGEMKDAPRAPHGLRQLAGIEQIAFDQAEILMVPRRRHEFSHSRAEIVVAYDLLAIAQETIDEIAADETGSARHEDHGSVAS